MNTLTLPPPPATTASAPPTVFIVDDDPSICRSLSRLIRLSGWAVQTYSSAENFLQSHPTPVLHPACMVLDLQMPGMDGLELQRQLAAERTPCPVVFMSGNGEVADSVQAMKQGAVTFLAKPFDCDELLKIIKGSLEKHADQLAASRYVDEVLDRIESLSVREREVMGWVITGALNKQIAARLGITVQTVKVHRGRAMEKMHTSSVADLVRLCAAAGFKPPAEEGEADRPKVQ